MIRVVIADDQRIVRDGLVTLVGLIDGVEVAGVAEDGAQAVALADAADVILMDLNMPNMSGVEATKAVSDRVKVLILTTYADDESIFGALEAGARGYLTKDAGLEDIGRAIHAVHAGQTHLDPAVQARLVQAAVGAKAPTTAEDDLTEREAEVLTLIADGLSNQEIAAQLVVSLATVKTHVNRVFAKTGARDRAQAVRYAYRTGRVSRT